MDLGTTFKKRYPPQKKNPFSEGHLSEDFDSRSMPNTQEFSFEGVYTLNLTHFCMSHAALWVPK